MRDAWRLVDEQRQRAAEVPNVDVLGIICRLKKRSAQPYFNLEGWFESAATVDGWRFRIGLGPMTGFLRRRIHLANARAHGFPKNALVVGIKVIEVEVKGDLHGYRQHLEERRKV